jgi:ubiquinone/menaquinone biosynthesis C-methylase UbiE
MFQAESEHWWYKNLRDEAIYWIEKYSQERQAVSVLKLLDVGCGTGGMLARLQERFKNVEGLGMDYYEMPLHFAKKIISCPLIRADAKSLPFPQNTFDVITCLDVLYTQEVFPAFDRVLADMCHLLKPPGILILQVPAFKALYSQHDVNVHGAHRFTVQEIRNGLQRAGFSRTVVYYRYNLLLGLAWMVRKIWRNNGTASHVATPPAPLNSALYKYFKLESDLNKRMSIPFGLSVFAVAARSLIAVVVENFLRMPFWLG